MKRTKKTLGVSHVTSKNKDLIGEEDEDEVIDWVKIPLTESGDQSICVSLRQLQHRRGCSNALLDEVLEIMRPYLRSMGPGKYTEEDQKMQKEAGVHSMGLNGCPNDKCDGFIFLPKDPRKRCPWCGHPRYSTCGKPLERVWYFPIKERLLALMRLPAFVKNINYEKERPVYANSEYMSDVYDTPAWRKQTGETARDQPGSDNNVLACVLFFFGFFSQPKFV